MSDLAENHRRIELIEDEQARDPRYKLTEDGKLVPHRPDDQDFELNFQE